MYEYWVWRIFKKDRIRPEIFSYLYHESHKEHKDYSLTFSFITWVLATLLSTLWFSSLLLFQPTYTNDIIFNMGNHPTHFTCLIVFPIVFFFLPAVELLHTHYVCPSRLIYTPLLRRRRVLLSSDSRWLSCVGHCVIMEHICLSPHIGLHCRSPNCGGVRRMQRHTSKQVYILWCDQLHIRLCLLLKENNWLLLI